MRWGCWLFLPSSSSFYFLLFPILCSVLFSHLFMCFVGFSNVVCTVNIVFVVVLRLTSFTHSPIRFFFGVCITIHRVSARSRVLSDSEQVEFHALTMEDDGQESTGTQKVREKKSSSSSNTHRALPHDSNE